MKKLLISLLKWYKRQVSPNLRPACKFVPTCSEYAMEAIELYGAAKGSFMAIKRLLRCNPFSKGGYDPVPQPSTKHTGRDDHP